jgi:hypothetical protein
MRQGSTARGFAGVRVVSAAVAVRRQPDDRWPAWMSLLLVVGAGLACWTAVILTTSLLAG